MLHIQHLFAGVLISHFLVIKCSWTNPQPGLMSVNPKKWLEFCTPANKFWGCGGITDRQTWDWSCVQNSKLRRLIIHKLHEKESSNTQSSCCLQIKRTGCEFGKLQMQAHLGIAGPKHTNWHCCTLQNFLPVLTHWVSLVTTSAHCLPSHIETQVAFWRKPKL